MNALRNSSTLPYLNDSVWSLLQAFCLLWQNLIQSAWPTLEGVVHMRSWYRLPCTPLCSQTTAKVKLRYLHTHSFLPPCAHAKDDGRAMQVCMDALRLLDRGFVSPLYEAVKRLATRYRRNAVMAQILLNRNQAAGMTCNVSHLSEWLRMAINGKAQHCINAKISCAVIVAASHALTAQVQSYLLGSIRLHPYLN